MALPHHQIGRLAATKPRIPTDDLRAGHQPRHIVTITVMNTVSIQEIRFEFGKVKRALERGEELMLTYRNRPLAKLQPVAKAEPSGPDPALTFGDSPESLPPMTNADIDKAIYG